MRVAARPMGRADGIGRSRRRRTPPGRNEASATSPSRSPPTDSRPPPSATGLPGRRARAARRGAPGRVPARPRGPPGAFPLRPGEARTPRGGAAPLHPGLRAEPSQGHAVPERAGPASTRSPRARPASDPSSAPPSTRDHPVPAEGPRLRGRPKLPEPGPATVRLSAGDACLPSSRRNRPLRRTTVGAASPSSTPRTLARSAAKAGSPSRRRTGASGAGSRASIRTGPERPRGETAPSRPHPKPARGADAPTRSACDLESALSGGRDGSQRA
jgi:hypothetical protein